MRADVLRGAMDPPRVLETPRLLLRPVGDDDVDLLHSIFGDPETLLHFPRTYSRDEVDGFVRRHAALHRERGVGLRVATRKEDGAFVGDCGVSPVALPHGEEMELGRHLRREHWGRGYATEAARRVLDHAFADLGLERAVALILPRNAPSRRVAERLGMRVERTVEHAGLPHLLYVARAQGRAAAGDPFSR